MDLLAQKCRQSNFVNVEETARVTALLDARRADLEALMNEWEEVAQTIEANL